MASFNHSVPSPDISDVMSFLRTMKKQNEEILSKLNSIEDDNRKLRQELHEIKSSLVSSRKRNQSEDELEDENEHSKKTKRARVKNSSRKRDKPEYELDHQNEPSNSSEKPRVSAASILVSEPPASFDSLDDDCLGNVLDLVGKKCYSAFGRVNKRCHEMFCSKGLPKETYFFGYAPLHLIQQQPDDGYYLGYSKGVFHYNRRDISDWMLGDESNGGYWRLSLLCHNAIKESRLDILREVFQRGTGRQLDRLRDCNMYVDLCSTAAEYGKLECMKLLRENECGWNEFTWRKAKHEGHEHILQYLRDNGYSIYWQYDTDVDSEDNSDY